MVVLLWLVMCWWCCELCVLVLMRWIQIKCARCWGTLCNKGGLWWDVGCAGKKKKGSRGGIFFLRVGFFVVFVVV